MAKALLQTRLFGAGVDFSGSSNKLEVKAEVDEQETTNWLSVDASGRPWKEVIGGLGSCSLQAEGQWEAGGAAYVDDALQALRGNVAPWSSTSTVAAAVGDVAYLATGLTKSTQLFGAVGDVAPWTAEISGSSPLARGRVLHPPGTARTATGTGTAVQVGAVPAGKQLWAALHVLSAAGTTPAITVAVQADNAVGFPSPTTVGTFTAVTVAGGQWLACSGYGADDWYRLSWTITGTSPSFLFVATVGIG